AREAGGHEQRVCNRPGLLSDPLLDWHVLDASIAVGGYLGAAGAVPVVQQDRLEGVDVYQVGQADDRARRATKRHKRAAGQPETVRPQLDRARTARHARASAAKGATKATPSQGREECLNVLLVGGGEARGREGIRSGARGRLK